MTASDRDRELLVDIQAGDLLSLQPVKKDNLILMPCLWHSIDVIVWQEDMSFFYDGLYTEISSGVVVKKHLYSSWHGKLFQGVEILTPAGTAKITLSDLKNVDILLTKPRQNPI